MNPITDIPGTYYVNKAKEHADAAAMSADSANSAADSVAFIYPATYSSAPAARPDGSAVQVGDVYFNSTSNLSFRWNGSSWVSSDINTANLAASGGASLIGFLQSMTGSVATTLQAKAREILSLKDGGADSTSTNDASNAITEAFTEGQNSNRPVRVGGEKYKITSAVLLPYHVEADFGQAYIDGSAVPSGQYAITAKNLSGATNLQYPSMWKGLRLDLGTSGAYGVKIDAPPGQWAVSNFAAETWNIKGGAIGLAFGDNTWLCNFRNVQVSGQSSIGVWGKTGQNSGESMNWYGGVIANIQAGDGVTGRGFKTEPGQTGGTWKFFGTSFDYSDVNIEHTEGTLELHGCHVEQSGSQPMCLVTQVAGKAAISFASFGGNWIRNPAATSTSVIKVNGSADVDIVGGQCPAINGNENLEFLTVVGGKPRINIRGVNFNLFPDYPGGNLGRICGWTSLVRNGDFETGTLDGWGMDALNFIRNSAFSGGVSGTIGSSGSWPTNMGLVGSLNGMNQPTLTFTTSGGKPVMQVHFTGTPTVTGSTGIYLDNSSGILSQQGDLWTERCYVRTIGNPVGINGYNLGVTERDAGGAALTSGSTAFTPTTDRQLYAHQYTVAQATTHHLNGSLNFTYTNGVAVDMTLEIECPSLMLRPMVYKDIYRSDTAASLPTYRVALDTTSGRTSAKALKVYSTAAESIGVYATIPVKSHDWLMARGYPKIAAVTAGGAGLKVSWRDAQDNEISNQNIQGDGTYKTVVSDYVQHSGVRSAPVGTDHARLYAWLEGFNGTVYFDDIETWVI